MTTALEIHDLAEVGQLQLRWRSGEKCLLAPPVPFSNPLDDSDRVELGWYFQDYLDNPFGQSKERSDAVETGLRNLGRLLFEVVFRSNDEAQSIYADAADDGLEQSQLHIISNRPEFLALPWELLNEPEVGYLTARLASVVRRSTGDPLPPYADELTTEQFNLLLVSPMPKPADASPHPSVSAGSGNMSVETVKVLESLNIQVELDYLYPPTWESLSNRLSQRHGHYHLVHFDGITCDGNAANLVLENAEYRPDPIPVTQMADLLVAAGVPAVLLTAGIQPGNPAWTVWEEIASSLTGAGVPCVTTVSHPLHGSATKESFVQRFYQSLTQGIDVPSCVALARQALMDEPQRVTLVGKVVFWDWTLPHTHQSRSYNPPVIQEDQPDPLAPPVIQPAEQTDTTPPLPAPGQFGLVGRASELRQVQRLLDQSPVVLLAGKTGVGKTELALGLGRWIQQNGREQRPGGVFYTSFEASQPAWLERVIHEIGTSVAGLEFADLNAAQQRRWVVEYLLDRPSLLIWDNLQNVTGSVPAEPEKGSGVLSSEAHTELDSFLSEVTQEVPAGSGSSALLVTNRPSESWLTVPHLSQELKGLLGHDRLELAGIILDQAGVEARHVGPDCPELLDLIEGHPLAVQISLPLLKEVPSSVLLGELRRSISELQPSAAAEDRDPYLTAAMEYAWGKLSHRNRTHLPFLALFQQRVMMDILNHITQEQAYRNVMGEQLGWGACRTLLRSAQAAGFLQPISPSVYQIHQALPQFYGSKLTRQVAGPGIRQLELEFVRVYADTADYFMESLYENQNSGVTAVLAEEGNLTQALGLALEAEQWDNAQLLTQPLAQVYRMQKRYPELRRLRQQLLESIGQTATDAEAKGAIELWLYLLGTDANEAAELLELERAEELNQQLLAYLSAQPEGDKDPRTAAVCHQFGVIALNRRQLDQAADWLQRSLAIIEDGDDPASIADDFFALGQVKQHQRYYTEAKEWYKKALDLHQRMPDEEEMVKDYRALASVSQLKFEYQEAESWCHRARDLVEESRDEQTAILIYHQLGTICHAQYQYDEAKDLYQQALHLSDRLGNQAQMVVEFHHLGLLEQGRAILYDEAEEWYIIALEHLENLGDRRGVGEECRQLGVLFHEQKRYDEAQKWYTQAREVFEELGDIQRSARTYGQLGMIAEEQDDLTGALEWVARTYKLALDHDLPVLVQVKAHLARLRDKYGENNFAGWWLNYTGDEPPGDLEVDVSTIL